MPEKDAGRGGWHHQQASEELNNESIESLPHWSDVVRPPAAYMLIRAGGAEQRFRFAFSLGGQSSLRQAWRACCPLCRPLIASLASHYQYHYGKDDAA